MHIFLPLHHAFTAASMEKLFLNQLYRLNGMPMTIVYDRDSILTRKLWKELFRLADVQLNMSSPYQPQTDGQSERVN